MGFQFLHIETYSRSGAASRPGTRAIFAEAGREAEYCAHVEHPRPPRQIYGAPIADTEALLQQQCEAARDPRGRKIRKDASVLLAGVASYPVPVADLVKDRAAAPDYQKWQAHTLRFLKQEYGEALRSVILHTDEGYPHLHFYVVPDMAAGQRLDDLHRGRKAMATLGYEKGNLAERRKSYREAMKGFQDAFYQQVGHPCGMTRRGPGRRRLSRAAWKAEQVQAALQARMLEERNRAVREKARTDQEKADLEAENQRLRAMLDAVFSGTAGKVTMTEKGPEVEVPEKAQAVQTAPLPGLELLDRPPPDAPSY